MLRDGCRDCEKFGRGDITFTTLLPFIFILQPHQQFSMSKELRHDRHTVSLLTDHMVFSPKYRGKVLVGDVAMLAEAIIRKTCKELDIKIIDMSVSSDHIHLFIQYPPKYSVSFIAKRLKGRTSRILRQEFPELKKWCKKVSGHQAAIMEVLGMAGKLLRNISPDKIENRDAEYYKHALDLSPVYSNFRM